MTVRYPLSICIVALLGASSACDSRTLKTSAHTDAAIKTRDSAPGMDLAPISQLPMGGQCPGGYAPCGKDDGLRCFDLSRSQEHCGACANRCGDGIVCQAGSCQQPICKGALSFKTLVLGSTGSVKAAADFDGDGILDLVFSSDPDGEIAVLYGAGDGTFPTRQAIDLGTDPNPPDSGANMGWDWQARAVDLDGDGLADLIAARNGEASFTVRLGTGIRDLPFGQPKRYSTTGAVFAVSLADWNGDGRLDLMASAGQAFEYWQGQPDARFERQAVQAVIDSPNVSSFGPGLTQAIDWNGDGILDLVYGDGGFGAEPWLGAGGKLHYRLGGGDGSFGPDVSCALAMGMVADLDHDGRPDLLCSPPGRGASILLGIDGCSAGRIVPVTDWTKQGGVAFADFNGDGNLDVVIDDNQAIMVHVGDGQGGFPHALTIPAPADGQWPLGAFFVGDLNQDGKLDVVFSRQGGWGALLNTCP